MVIFFNVFHEKFGTFLGGNIFEELTFRYFLLDGKYQVKADIWQDKLQVVDLGCNVQILFAYCSSNLLVYFDGFEYQVFGQSKGEKCTAS